MDWTTRLNKVMDYVEASVHGEISEEEISKIAACPYSMFQSSFSQIVGIPFSEYVRRRRLTMAAYELLNTDRKLLDIAMDYGYQSDDAFRVAFKNLYGITPAEVRKSNPSLVFYCRLTFEINIRGDRKNELQRSGERSLSGHRYKEDYALRRRYLGHRKERRQQ